MRAPIRSSTVSSPVRAGLADCRARTGATRAAASRRRRTARPREVAGHVDRVERQALPAARDRARPLGDARAGGAQQPLGVVARRRRLDHGRRPVRRSARRAGCTTSPAPRRPAARSRSAAARRRRRVQGGRPSVARDVGAHQPERRRDAVDRPAADRGVAVDHEACRRLPGEQARQEAHQRARVRDVERAGRLAQAAQADAVDDEVAASSTRSTRAPSDATAASVASVSALAPNPRTARGRRRPLRRAARGARPTCRRGLRARRGRRRGGDLQAIRAGRGIHVASASTGAARAP